MSFDWTIIIFGFVVATIALYFVVRHKRRAELQTVPVTSYSQSGRHSDEEVAVTTYSPAASRSFCSCILSCSSCAWAYARSASSGVHSGSSDGGVHPLGLRPRGILG